ncbi:substrate-binding domain-containing protein [Streptomyces sp. NPDC051018]|uniref:substrate-binding domain-containing protein n=1 Tax=Streptomyces sp. NPDC051018 TaxID=3365639 RepID=UPI0037AE6BF7
MDRTYPRSRKLVAVVALATAAALPLAGCSSSSGGKEADEGGANASAGRADTPRMTVALVTHQAPGDTFWSIVRKGAEVAAAKDNIKLVYSADPNAGGQANLVQNAIDQKVDGIAVTLAKPDALKDVIGKAKAANIPIVGLNSGVSEWQKLGLMEFFGQDETVAGEALGKQLNEANAKKAVCVIQEQGNIGLTQRCNGVKKTFKGTTETLNVNGTDMPSVKSTITAKLTDGDIDYVVALAAPIALTAVKSVDEAGSKAKIATFDLNKELTGAISKGDIEFAVDQQPYLQGYLAIDSLWLFKSNGNYMGGGEAPVLTGPAIVDKTNVEKIDAFAAKGTR